MVNQNETPGFRPGEDWPTISELANGYDEYILPDSEKLVGREIDISWSNNTRTIHHFIDKNTLEWLVPDAEAKRAQYKALEVRDNIFFIDYWDTGEDEEITFILNLRTGQALNGTSSFHDVKGAPRTRTTFIDGCMKGFESAKPFSPTGELLGKHVFYRYNTRDCYEHFYHNSGTFAWHCISGVEEGVASTDPCSFRKLDDELYLIYWSELVMPVESMVVIDLKQLRSTGRFFCWDPKPRKPLQMVFGSYATVLADLKAKRRDLLSNISPKI